MNGLISSDVEKTQQWLFRIANVEGSPGNIDRISPLFPWKVGDGGSSIFGVSGEFTKSYNSLVVVDALTPDTQKIPHSGNSSLVLYNAPTYPYIPYNVQTSGTSYTFSNGGMVICTSPTTVTVFAGEPKSLVFNNFVGILPIGVGTKVTTSVSAIFAGY